MEALIGERKNPCCKQFAISYRVEELMGKKESVLQTVLKISWSIAIPYSIMVSFDHISGDVMGWVGVGVHHHHPPI